MRIGIDAHAIGERKTGNERFVANLIPAMRKLCDHEFVLYFTREEVAAAWEGLDQTSIRVLRPGHPLARIPFTLPYRAVKDHLDVLLVQYTAPPIVPCPVVTVVHDVAFAVFPQYYSRFERIWMRRTIPPTMRRAAGIVTVSRFSRSEIGRVYGLDPGRITVAYDGVDPVFTDPAPRASPVAPPFFLVVGNLQPRKNLAMLVRAYRRLVRDHPEIPERLVVVGQEWYRAEGLQQETADLRASGRLWFTGYVSDGDLVGLLRAATAFAYPSVYEGFGLPPVEAMAVGTPTVVSDIPVTREVVGEAALRLPPTDVAAWSDALARLASDEGLRSTLVRRGKERAMAYTWEACARSVISSLEAAAGPNRRPSH